VKKNIFLSLLFFIFGFLTHAFFFPEILSNGFVDIKSLIVPDSQTQVTDQNTGFKTEITFDGERFSRNNITLQTASYLTIINKSKDKQMWLNSNNPLLATKRGYGESEAIQLRLDQKGQFVVSDKNNPNEKLIIVVK
jgi:hypothetical protein